MANVEVPAGISIILDDERLKEIMLELWPDGPPQGPGPSPVSGAVLSYRSALFSPGHAIPAGVTFLDSPILLKVTPASAQSRFIVEFSGRVGATVQTIIDVALKRNGAALPLPSGSTALDSPRVDLGADSTHLSLFKIEDLPNTTSEVTYRVIARNRNGTGYFGRRGDDQSMNSPLFMSITEYAE